jgi:hypothetical protein
VKGIKMREKERDIQIYLRETERDRERERENIGDGKLTKHASWQVCLKEPTPTLLKYY